MTSTPASSAENDYAFTVNVTGEGQPMILIPGLISSAEVWDDTVEYFSKVYECHVLNMPGFAGVPPQKNGPYLEVWETDIIRYIQDHNLEDVVLVGHSMGGFLSLKIGISQLNAVKKIVIVDALPFLAAAGNPAAQPGFNEEIAKQYIASFDQFDENQTKQMRYMSAQGFTSDSTKWNTLVEWSMASDLKTEAYSVTEMMGIDLRESIEQITVPVLVLAPFQENPNFPQFTREIMQEMYMGQYRKLPNLRFEVADNSRHFIMFDQPDWMHHTIENFLSDENF